MPALRRLPLAILLTGCLCAWPVLASDNSDAVAAAQSAAAAASSAMAAAKAAASAASAAAAAAPDEPVLSFVPELTLWFVLAMFVLGVGVPIRKLSRSASGWSLTDALSEKAPAPAAVVQAAVAVVPAAAGAAAAAPAGDPGSTASASRLVAFLGTIAILTLFMGFGLYAIWAAFNGRAAEARDTLKAVSSYLLYGSAMYAPYAFNQIKAAFSS